MALHESSSPSEDFEYDSWDEDCDDILEDGSDYENLTQTTTFTDDYADAQMTDNQEHDDDEDMADAFEDYSDYDSDDDDEDLLPLTPSNHFVDETSSHGPGLPGRITELTKDRHSRQTSYDQPSKRKLSDEEIQQAALRMLTLRNEGVVRKEPGPTYDILSGLIDRPEIMELVARWLDPDSLCNLYCVSKRFHFLMNTKYQYCIKNSASVWAPFGRKVFPFHAFRDLCIQDPASRPIPHKPTRVRHIPGINYLKMIVGRQNIVDGILIVLDKAGHRLPRDAHITLQKIWFTMSIPGNGARIGLLHNRNYWTDSDLFLATHFFLKLDMHFTDPVDGAGEHVLRDVFLSKNSLLPLHKLLHGEYTPLQIVQHFVAFDYRVPATQRGLPIFGIPAHLVGQGCVEGWGAGKERALGIGEGVMLKSIKRGMNMNQYYMDMMLYGWSEITDNIKFDLEDKEPRVFDEKEKLVDWRLRQYGLKEI